MKAVLLCAGLGGLAFFMTAYQTGLFENVSEADAPPAAAGPVAPPRAAAKKSAPTRFPNDLIPAVRADAVPQAAPFDAQTSFRVAIFKTSGHLYQDWQDKLKEQWQADSVENTALVLVLGPQRKIFVDIIPYPNGAPPISRYKFELEASVVEAKTGKVLANRLFINVPRNIQRIETWDTTALGSPVEFRTVFYWLASGARAGFPPIDNPSPIVTVVN